MTLIASQVLGSSASSVTFSSIPQTYKDLKIISSTRDISSGNPSSNMTVQFNGDATTKYSQTILRGNGGSASAVQGGSYTYWLNYVISSGSASTANTFGSEEFYIPNYISSTTKQSFSFGAGENNSSTAGNQWIGIVANYYQGTSPITSITLDLNGNTISTNSSFYLYGIKNS